MAAQQDELEASSESTPGLALKPAQRKTMPFWRVLGTVLSLGLLVYLIRLQGWNEFIQVLGRLPAYTFALAVAFMLLSRVCVASRWFVLLHSAKARVNYWQCLRLTFMGLFASNFLPTTIGGDLVRMAGTVHLRVDAGVAAASLVLDRLIGMAGMSALAPLGLATDPSPRGRFSEPIFSCPGGGRSCHDWRACPAWAGFSPAWKHLDAACCTARPIGCATPPAWCGRCCVPLAICSSPS